MDYWGCWAYRDMLRLLRLPGHIGILGLPWHAGTTWECWDYWEC